MKTHKIQHTTWQRSWVGKSIVWFMMIQMALFQCMPLYALPHGEQVTHGDVTFTRDGNLLTVNQASGKAIVNYNSFDIGAPETVNFVQPGASAAILNRVTGAGASQIAGALNANGQVYLINPNGILFSSSARVNVGGLVASAMPMSDSDFLDGRLFFSGGGGAVINEGELRAGFVYLAGSQVENRGLIQAADVLFGAGQQSVLIDEAAGGEIRVIIDGEDALVTGDEVLADDVTTTDPGVTLDEVVENLAEVVEEVDASSLVLSAYDEGTIVNEGMVDASGLEGGSITLSGVAVGQLGELSADGTDGAGGSIHIYATEEILLAAGSRTTADAGATGAGGNVILISQGETVVEADANISATGGSSSGAGGFAEVSGHAVMLAGDVDLRASDGSAGTLLIDPTDFTISTNITGVNNWNVTDLIGSLDGANVTVQTSSGGGDPGDINWTAVLDLDALTVPNRILTLDAHNNVLITTDGGVTDSDTLTPDSLNLVLNADSANVAGGNNDAGDVIIHGSIDLYGGSFTASGVHFTNSAAVQTGGGAISLNQTGLVDINATLDSGGGLVDINSTGAGDITIAAAVNSGIGSIDVDNTSGSITLAGAGSLTATGNGTVALNADGLVADDVILDGTMNTATGNVTVSANNDVTVNNTITTTGGNIFLTADSNTGGTGDVLINASLNSGTGRVSLAGVQISQTGGSITGDAIEFSAEDGVTLDQVGNDVNTIAGTTINNGAISVVDANGLAIGNVGSQSGLTSSGGSDIDVDVLNGDLALDANVDAGDGTVSLAATNGAISWSAGTITASNLALRAANGVGDAASIPTVVNLLAAENTSSGSVRIENSNSGALLTIGDVDGVTGVSNAGAGGVMITNNSPLTVDSDVVSSGGGDIELIAAGMTAGDDLTINANVTASGGSGNILLSAGDSILHNTGTVSAAGSGNITYDAAGGSGSGSILIGAGAVASTDTGTLALTSDELITLDGTLTTSSGKVSILSSNGVSQAGGSSIASPDLVLMGAGTFDVGGSNDVGHLAADVSGSLSFVNTNDLAVATVMGVNGVNTDGNALDIEAAGSLTLGADVNSGADDTRLASTGSSIVQTNGSITAAGLEFDASTIVTLDQAGNDVDTVAGVAGGAITIVDTDDLAVGAVGGTTGITSAGAGISLSADGDLDVDEVLSAVGLIALTADADTSGAGKVTITEPVTTGGGAFTADGFDFELTDQGPAGGSIDTDGGSVTIGNVTMDMNNALFEGDIFSGDGAINGGNITVTTTNGITIMNAALDTTIGVGGSLSIGGGVTLQGGQTDLIVGAGDLILDGGGVDLILDNATLNFDGANGLLTARRDVQLINGSEITSENGFNIAIAADNDGIANTDGLGTAFGGVLIDGTSTVFSDGTLTITGTELLTDPTKSIQLEGDVGADGDVTITGNAGTLTDIDLGAVASTNGAISVTSRAALNVNGVLDTLSPNNITLVAATDVAFHDSVNSIGNIFVDAAGGAISQTSGTLTANGLGMIAANGIGDASPLQTDVNVVTATNSTAGAIQIQNTGSLSILGTAVNGTPVVGVANGAGDVLVETTDSLAVSDLAAGADVTLHAGTDGTGDLTFGAGATLRGDRISVLAGDGAGGGALATVDTRSNSPTFTGAGGGVTSPSNFVHRQDGDILGTDIAAGAQFAGGTAGIDYTLQSVEGSVQITDASSGAGTDLTVDGATGVDIDASLSVNTADITGSPTTIAGDIITAAGLTLNDDALLDGAVAQTLEGGTGTLTAQALTKTTNNLTLGGDTLVDLDGDVDVQVGSLTVQDAANAAGDLTGVGVSLNAAVTLDGTGDQVIDAGTGTLDADGTITKTTAGNLNLGGDTLVDLEDSIDVQMGSLTLENTFESAGTWILASSNVTFLGVGTFDGVGHQYVGTMGTLSAAGSLSKTTAGNLTLQEPILADLDGDLSAANGSLIVTGPADVEGNVTAIGGSVAFSNDAVLAGDVTATDIFFQGAVTFDGVGNQVADAGTGTLDADSTITKSSAGSLTLSGNTLVDVDDTIDVQAGFLIVTDALNAAGDINGVGVQLQGAVTMDGAGDQQIDAGTLLLTAADTVTKSTSGNLTLSGDALVNLTGAVDVQNGNLTVEDGLNAESDLMASGSVDLQAAASVGGDVVAGSNVTLQAALTLDGVGDQNVDAGAGTLDAQSTITKTTGGNLALGGDTLIDLTGTVDVDAGDLTVEDEVEAEANLVASGNVTLEGVVTLDGGGSQRVDAEGGTLTASSTITKTTGGNLALGGDTLIDLTGTVDVDAGDLTVEDAVEAEANLVASGNVTLHDQVTLDGTVAQTIDAEGGTLTASNTITKTGTGNLTLAGATLIDLDGTVDVDDGSLILDDSTRAAGDLLASGDILLVNPVELDGVVDQRVDAQGGTLMTASGITLLKSGAGDLFLGGGTAIDLDDSVIVRAGSLTVEDDYSLEGDLLADQSITLDGAGTLDGLLAQTIMASNDLLDVNADLGKAVNDLLLCGGTGIELDGSVTMTVGTLSLTSPNGTVNQNSGTISAPSVAFSVDGDITLGQNNDIDVIAGTAGGQITIIDADDLTVGAAGAMQVGLTSIAAGIDVQTLGGDLLVDEAVTANDKVYLSADSDGDTNFDLVIDNRVESTSSNVVLRATRHVRVAGDVVAAQDVGIWADAPLDAVASGLPVTESYQDGAGDVIQEIGTIEATGGNLFVAGNSITQESATATMRAPAGTAILNASGDVSLGGSLVGLQAEDIVIGADNIIIDTEIVIPGTGIVLLDSRDGSIFHSTSDPTHFINAGNGTVGLVSTEQIGISEGNRLRIDSRFLGSFAQGDEFILELSSSSAGLVVPLDFYPDSGPDCAIHIARPFQDQAEIETFLQGQIEAEEILDIVVNGDLTGGTLIAGQNANLSVSGSVDLDLIKIGGLGNATIGGNFTVDVVMAGSLNLTVGGNGDVGAWMIDNTANLSFGGNLNGNSMDIGGPLDLDVGGDWTQESVNLGGATDDISVGGNAEVATLVDAGSLDLTVGGSYIGESVDVGGLLNAVIGGSLLAEEFDIGGDADLSVGGDVDISQINAGGDFTADIGDAFTFDDLMADNTDVDAGAINLGSIKTGAAMLSAGGSINNNGAFISAGSLSMTAGSNIGGNGAIQMNVGTINLISGGGDVRFIQNKPGETAIGLLSAGGELVVGVPNGGLIDGNGDGLNIRSGGSSTFDAQFLGTGQDALEVNIGGNLFLNGAGLAGDGPENASRIFANLVGEINGDGRRIQYIGNVAIPGLVLFNGQLLLGDQFLLREVFRSEAFVVETPEIKSPEGVFGDPYFIHLYMQISEAWNLFLDYILFGQALVNADPELPPEAKRSIQIGGSEKPYAR